MKTKKYYIVKRPFGIEIMSGQDISIIQQSGGQVKVHGHAKVCPMCGNKTFFHDKCELNSCRYGY